MSELEVPERAWKMAARKKDRLGAVRAASPIIIAAELRQLADELYELRRSIREADDRGIRSSAIGEVITTLQQRADLLDPDGMAW